MVIGPLPCSLAIPRVIAVGLVLIGLFGGGLALFGVVAAGGLLWLIVIGLFIMLAGANEVRLVRLRRWRRRFVTPEGAEIIPPGSPDDPPQEPRPGLMFFCCIFMHKCVHKCPFLCVLVPKKSI